MSCGKFRLLMTGTSVNLPFKLALENVKPFFMYNWIAGTSVEVVFKITNFMLYVLACEISSLIRFLVIPFFLQFGTTYMRLSS